MSPEEKGRILRSRERGGVQLYRYTDVAVILVSIYSEVDGKDIVVSICRCGCVDATSASQVSGCERTRGEIGGCETALRDEATRERERDGHAPKHGGFKLR